MRCVLCNKEVKDETALTNGQAVHHECKIQLENAIESFEANIIFYDNRIARFGADIKKKDGALYRAVNIFKDVDREIYTIAQSLTTAKSSRQRTLWRIADRKAKLNIIYDYFPTYPDDWDERRKTVTERDGDSCSICGNDGNLQLHHATPLSKGGSNKISNLVLLCNFCHSNEHGGRDFSREYHNDETAFAKRVSTLQNAIRFEARVEFLYRKHHT